MGDEFYAIIKLVSSEEIFSLVIIDENDGDPVIILQNPVIMKVFHNGQGSYIKVKPWMEIPNDEVFLIKLDKVITMTETKDKKMIDLYNHYLSDDSVEVYKPGGKVKLSEKMGYISSVEDARKRFENSFKGIKES